MNRPVSIAVLAAAALLASCASTEPVAAPAAPASSPAAASSPVPPSAPPASKPSHQETARLDRELGSAVVPYPFDTCAVIQKPFDGAAKYRRIYQGYEVLFCCTPCVRAFDANPDPYMPRIKAAADALKAGSPAAAGPLP